MTAPLREQAPAKINLTLRVLGRRDDDRHDLESLVVFADLGDTLTLEPGPGARLHVEGVFAEACGPAQDNLVLKAARAANLPAGSFILDKQIPVAAGLGGGSADAAAALRLIARANGLPLNDPRLKAAAREAGSDIAVCLDSRARIMRGAGEELSEPLALPKLDALLINPRTPLPTKNVFAAFTPRGSAAGTLDVPGEKRALLQWLAGQDNDLTRAAVECVPEIADVLRTLAALPGAKVVRMSGSGATCFALFESAKDAESAERALAVTHLEWWIRRVTIG